jgi:hypothetical protein
MGKFQISQAYKGAAHDGLDLVGIDSKEIHATATGEVVFAGWENPSNHSQGFGQYVVILADGRYYHYGHLSEIRVSVGQQVRCTDVIGIEGSTGCSTGSHCHYCVRTSMSPGTALDVCAISGIPNDEWGIYDDGYRPQAQAQATTPAPDIRALQLALNTEGCMLDVDGICGPKTLAAARKQHIYNGASGEVVRWVQSYLNSIGYNCGIVDGISGKNTMAGINAWQKAQGVGVGEMYGSDWDVLLA